MPITNKDMYGKTGINCETILDIHTRYSPTLNRKIMWRLIYLFLKYSIV